MDTPTSARTLLRHTVATLAYRAEKVLRDTPQGFASLKLSPASRTPLEIVSHLGDLMAWGARLARGEYKWVPEPATDWDQARVRFFRELSALDEAIRAEPLTVHPPGMIFQGPIADALTHVGQLALMRGIAGGPVRPESYARAEIQIGRVGADQSMTRKEFDGDASKPKK